MPQEAGRTTSLKRIYNPDDHSQYVDIQVIDEISFIDPNDRHQETQYTFSNLDEETDREVHAVTVTSTVSPPDKVRVERIDILPVLDPNDRNQETRYSLDNVTGEELSPPHFSTHSQTHTKKIFGTGPNADCWILVERIDVLKLIDPNDRYQETHLTLSAWSDESN